MWLRPLLFFVILVFVLTKLIGQIKIRFLTKEGEFRVKIKKGSIKTLYGAPPSYFLDDVLDLLGKEGRGEIWSVRERNTILLKFSKNIPLDCQQRIRNIWGTRSHV